MLLQGRSSWLCAVALLVAACAPATQAYTDPNNYNKLVAFRDAMRSRSPNWAAAIQTWTCPTPPANSAPAGACDPCGQSYDGNWYHMHCRGNTRGWGESGDGTINGISTNMHITSSLVDGPVPKELCVIPTLREHDFGGQLNRGHLTGPFPRWLAKCYPALEELDLSNNRLTGTLPPYLSTMPVISEIKVENNALIGTIPPELGSIKRLRRFQVEFNEMRGRIPETFKNAAPYLTQFHIASNDFEGNLSMLATAHLTTASVHDNAKLCGMVPSNIRFAKGYNPGGTNLGRPCAGTSGVPTAAAAAAVGGGEGGAGTTTPYDPTTETTAPQTTIQEQNATQDAAANERVAASPAAAAAPAEAVASPAPASDSGSSGTSGGTQPGSNNSSGGSRGNGSGQQQQPQVAATASPSPADATDGGNSGSNTGNTGSDNGNSSGGNSGSGNSGSGNSDSSSGTSGNSGGSGR